MVKAHVVMGAVELAGVVHAVLDDIIINAHRTVGPFPRRSKGRDVTEVNAVEEAIDIIVADIVAAGARDVDRVWFCGQIVSPSRREPFAPLLPAIRHGAVKVIIADEARARPALGAASAVVAEREHFQRLE